MSPEGLRAWFEDWLDACNRHDLDAVRDLLAPDVRRAGEPSGADAWIRDLAELLAAFPDQRWKRIRVVIEEDRIAAHLRTRGTHRRTWHGVPATGRRVGAAEFWFLRVVGGRITEAAGSDASAVLAQLR